LSIGKKHTFVVASDSLTDSFYIENIFRELINFLKKILFPVVYDPFKIFEKKASPSDELEHIKNYQIAVIVTLNRAWPTFKTPYFTAKFLKPPEINEELSKKVANIFKMEEIRPEFPKLSDEPGEHLGFEKILGMIDTSDGEGKREFGVVFGRRGIYVRNSDNDGKLRNGAFVPYQKLETEFPKLLPENRIKDNKATVLKIAYGCYLDISNLNECVSNENILLIFKTLIDAIKIVLDNSHEKEEAKLEKKLEKKH